jgi:hypothetical protein
MDSSIFDVSIPPTDPGARLVIRHMRGTHVITREGEPSFRLTVTGPSRHVAALVDAYNAQVERVREEARSDAGEGGPHAPLPVHAGYAPPPPAVVRRRPCRILADFMEHC